VEDVARRTAADIEKVLRAAGRTFHPEADDAEPPELLLDEPGLAACYAAAAQGISVSGDRAGLPTLRLVFPPEPPPRSADIGPLADEPVAEVRGINVHAKQVVDGRDRQKLERLCRYITRPPVAQERLERLADGRLELRLRYFGVLSSHSRWRKEVVPHPPPDPTATAPPPAPGDQLELALNAGNDEPPTGRKHWAWLLRHVFAADLDTCPRCSGPMRWLQAATTAEDARRLLARLAMMRERRTGTRNWRKSPSAPMRSWTWRN
jgi:Putative transposase